MAGRSEASELLLPLEIQPTLRSSTFPVGTHGSSGGLGTPAKKQRAISEASNPSIMVLRA